MASEKKNWKMKILFFVGLPMLQLIYQTVMPFLDQTKKMRQEAKKVEDSIRQIKSDSLVFSPEWEKQMLLKETQVRESLPDAVNASDILRYFATSFESNHPGVEFTSLVPQPPAQSSIIADRESPNTKARVSKLQIKAKIPSEYLFAYLEHVENYRGLSRIQEVNFSSTGEGTQNKVLALDMNVELYLTPKDWVPKNKKESPVMREVASSGKPQNGSWFSTELERESPVEVKKEERVEKSKVLKVSKPGIVVRQLVGQSVVINENLYEEGDEVQGWTISKIDPVSKILLLKKGNSTSKVVIP